jgi:low affinity Fe/Cu permease
MKKTFSIIAKRFSVWSASPWATITSMIFIGLWSLGGIFYFGFGLFYQTVISTIVSVVTFLMVFLLNHSQAVELKAIHLKLDELIRSQKTANNDMINIERLDDEQLEELIKIFQRRIKNQIN